jgi:hypothetical protein
VEDVVVAGLELLSDVTFLSQFVYGVVLFNFTFERFASTGGTGVLF